MKFVSLSFVPFVLMSVGALASEGKRAFEISDYYRTAFVGAPLLSPDGELTVFTVRHYELEAGESWTEIWMMDADGSDQRQITHGKKSSWGPSFSPDGSELLFVSNRDGGSQLYKIPVDGGESKQLTDTKLGISGPLWSPDGRYIAVTAEVYPECGADEECNQEINDAISDGKLEVHVADDLLYRHWTSWRDGRYTHILLVDAESGEIVKDMTPGAWDSPTFSLGGTGYAFSPDGKELCYVSNHDPDSAESTNTDLWVVAVDAESIDESTATNLSDENDGWDGDPVYSPDGSKIAYISQRMPGYESDLRRIVVHDRSNGETRYLTDRTNFDDMVDDMQWSKDASTIFFRAEHHGTTPMYRIPAVGGEIQMLHSDEYIGAWKLAPDGSAIVYQHRSVGEPPEIFSVPAIGGEPIRLTHFNQTLEEEVDIRPAESMWVEGDGDYQVQVFLVKPHGFDPQKTYPLILNVHGGPQGAWSDAYRGDWQVYPGKGYVVAFANPTGSTGYGQDLVDGIACDWGGRVFRDLMKVTDALEALPYVDAERMGAMGWSYGGYMMMWFQGHTDRFKAIAAMMGLYDMRSFYGATEELWFPEKDLCGTPWDSEEYEKWSPSNFVENFKTPSLVITGELDYRVPYTQSLMYFTALQKKKVPSRLIVYPNAGHWPSWHEMAFYYNAHLDWFQRYLGGEPAPWDVIEHSRNQAFGDDETASD